MGTDSELVLNSWISYGICDFAVCLHIYRYVFRRTYVQYALCAPSRTALLTSRRPDTSRVWAIGPYFRQTTGRNYTTLPQFFKNNGYRSIGHGKIFHEGNASGFPLDQVRALICFVRGFLNDETSNDNDWCMVKDQMYGSWSVPYFHPSDPYDHCAGSQPPCEPNVKTPLSHGKYIMSGA